MAVVIALLFTLSAIEVAFAGERPFDAGRVALHEGNFDKAISLFTEDIHLHPENGPLMTIADWLIFKKVSSIGPLPISTFQFRCDPTMHIRTAIARTLTKIKETYPKLLPTIHVRSS